MKKDDYLHLMGIDIWRERNEVTPQENTASKKVIPIAKESLNDAWADLEQRVKNCTACDLHKTRTNTVFGVGNRQADLLIIGEAPGQQEDLKGEPFVGRAGQLLNNMLRSIDLTRDDVYIANILKSRPPNNRDPRADEVAACTPFLLEQIALLQPKLMVAVGRIAAQFLLETKTPLSKLRNTMFEYGEQKTPLLITYHPAYLLRAPLEKRKAWEDWQTIQKQLKQL